VGANDVDVVVVVDVVVFVDFTQPVNVTNITIKQKIRVKNIEFLFICQPPFIRSGVNALYGGLLPVSLFLYRAKV